MTRSCNDGDCSNKQARKRKRSTRTSCSRSSMDCRRPAALASASIASPCCLPARIPSATSSSFRCSNRRNNRERLSVWNLALGISLELRAGNLEVPPAGRRSALHLKRHLCIHAVIGHPVIRDLGGEFLDVNRANIAQRFGCLSHDVLGSIFPTFF